MKAISLVPALALVLFTGCNDSSPTGGNVTSGGSTNASAGYLNSLAADQKRATKTIDATAMNKAVESYYVQEGHFPKDLLELVETRFLPLIPKLPDGATWEYDTNTGVVTIQKYGQ